MQELVEKLKNYSIDDFIKYEEEDRQFLALKKLFNSLKQENKGYALNFIVANSIVCYQLSGLGEDYWEEFSKKLGEYLNSGKTDIYKFFEFFLPASKANKRLLEIKLKRIFKIIPFLDKLSGKQEYYYQNMGILRDDLAQIMNQKKTAKTIVFAVKMFSYGARVYFDKLIYFPEDIGLPIDSRLEKIFEKYSNPGDKIGNFYTNLAKQLNIPELHLDAFLWINKEI